MLVSSKNVHIIFFDNRALFRKLINSLTILLNSAWDQCLKVAIFPSHDEFVKFLSGNYATVLVSNTGRKGIESLLRVWEFRVKIVAVAQEGDQGEGEEDGEDMQGQREQSRPRSRVQSVPFFASGSTSCWFLSPFVITLVL